MRREFYEIYEDMYKDLEFFSHSDFNRRLYTYHLSRKQIMRLVVATKNAIEEASSEIGDSAKLRPDAKYFLLLNFTEMVVLPIAAAREMETDGEIKELITEAGIFENIDHDIKMIIGEANQRRAEEVERLPWDERNGDDDREITGHNVIDVVHNLWDKIRFNEYLFWAKKR